MDVFQPNAKSAGRSCITCSKAKAKCVRQSAAGVCERCLRLKKQCHSKEPALKRKQPVKTTRTAQLKKLEDKLEHLVNALSTTASQSQPPHTVSHEPPASPTSQVPLANDQTISKSTAVLHSLCGDCGDIDGASDTSQGPSTRPTQDSMVHAPVGNFMAQLSEQETEVLLDRYKRLMAPGLPFVRIPDNATVQSMQETKPVLLSAICMVAYYHDLPRQQTFFKGTIALIGERVLMRGEKSIDILQAILVVAAWYHSHIFWSSQMTNILHIAISITIDTGIDRLSQLQDFRQFTTRAIHGPGLTNRIPSLEERRVLLGLFHTTSWLSSSFKKMDPLPFTPYMEDCLTALSQAREYDSDLFLVQMVRIQRVVNAIHLTETPAAATPRVFIKAFQADVATLRKEDPCTEGDNTLLQLQYLLVEIFIWELSLTDLQEKSKSHRLSSHLEDLCRLVSALKRFFDIWWTIPPSSYLLLPFSSFGQYAHAFICLIKLASLEIDGWDLKSFGDQLSFAQVVDLSVKRYEDATKARPDGELQLDNDAFGRWAARVSWMKQVYESKFAAGGGGGGEFPDLNEQKGGRSVEAKRPEQQQPAQQDQTQSQMGGQQLTPPDDFLSADFFGYLDEGLWSSFGGDFDLLMMPDNAMMM